MKKYARAFTLVELLVVMSIIGMLSSVVLVSLQSGRDKARISSAIIFSNNMYQTWGADALGYWKFNEETGQGAEDSGYNNIDLGTSPTGGTFTRNTNTPLQGGSSMDFSANNQTDTNNYFDSGDISSKQINLANGYTASVWLYFTDSDHAAGMPFVVSTRIAFMNFSSGGTQFYIGPSSSIYVTGVPVNYSIPIGKWVHFAYSYDGSSFVRLYIDGKIYQTSNVGVPRFSTLVNRVYVGNEGLNPRHFRGLIDDLAIYPNVLTADRIESIYAEGLPRHIFASNSK